MPPCNPKNIKSKDPAYECNQQTGRWKKKKRIAAAAAIAIPVIAVDISRLTKKQLLALPEAKKIIGRHAMKIADLRRMILQQMQPQPRQQQRRCKNETDIMGDDTADIPAAKFFRTSHGYCHDIDVLVQYLISSSIKNIDPNDPYNRQCIWENDQEKKKIWNHPGMEKDLKKQLMKKEKELHGKPLTDIHYPVLEKIVEIGWLIWNDQPTSHATDGFEASERLLIRLRSIIEESPDAATILHLRNGSDATTIQEEIFESSHISCIHGKGTFLIKLYLYHYFQCFADRRPIHPLFQIVKGKRVISPMIKLQQLVDVVTTTGTSFLKPMEFYLDQNKNAFVYTWVASNNTFYFTPQYEKDIKRIFKKSEKNFNEIVVALVLNYLYD